MTEKLSNICYDCNTTYNEHWIGSTGEYICPKKRPNIEDIKASGRMPGSLMWMTAKNEM